MPTDLRPGLLVLHGNRTELLAEAVFEWLRRSPLGALEEEVFLVQSNGVAEWLKMTLAGATGICAATRVELPGRFLWRAYRQVLGAAAVPAESSLDKLPLVWRLMQQLPDVATRPGFEPLAGFLAGGNMSRRLQLAQRLADLFDQYQVYRSDWLEAWAAGHDVIPGRARQAASQAAPLPPDQRWQAALWREVVASLDESERHATRPELHRRFLAALDAGTTPAAGATARQLDLFAEAPPGSAQRFPLPRRVVLFGMAHVPMQTLQALAALAAHSQVLLAIPNPCRYHWADIIQGRELLQMERRRQPLRAGRDLAAVGLEAMHAHAHPLLAAWGRQGRDFVRQLDAFDDVLAAQQRFAGTKVDLFDDGPGETLLQQVQARIRDLVPLAEHAGDAADPADRSIVFHIAHSAQREVEILHDQLLALLAHPPGGVPLNPRDIVVMVPEIGSFAPAIRSVFGQPPRADARFIPFDIADLADRGNDPLLVAFEWLLRLTTQRCTASELRDLLDVPAIAQRFGIGPSELPRLAQWMEGAGIRWGLGAAQRGTLDLAACGEQNTAAFGVGRMLLGYASGGVGGEGGFAGIEPYVEVGGLDASIAGSLASLVDALGAWWAEARTDAAPAQWAERGRALIEAFTLPTEERERFTVAALQDALRAWLEACDAAGFDAPVSLAVVREAWLSGIDEPALNRRFRAGGVTFCTLLPMRAIPFEVVALLGMNDGDYPRATTRADFDLMALPGQQRPGDRSRRDDDRQLMLEALLSARRVLYVGWVGRSARDNSEQPPSVLVSQLRDYLAAGWRGDVLQSRTTEHPLQPFSRRYFEVEADGVRSGEALFTHAREWRSAHALPAVAPVPPSGAVPFEADAKTALTIASLAAFLRNPVKHFFRHRLGVSFREDDDAADDAEPFAIGGLVEYQLLDECLAALLQEGVGASAELHERVERQVACLRRAGRLPIAEAGQRAGTALVETLLPMLLRWRAVQAQHPESAANEPLHFGPEGGAIDDWLTGLRATGTGARVWTELSASRLATGASRPLPRTDKLVKAWVRSLVAAACGVAVGGVIVGRDVSLTIEPLGRASARAALDDLLAAWRDGMAAPLPLACKTALAFVAGSPDAKSVYEGSAFANGGVRGEVEEACLARVFPDFEALAAEGRFALLAQRLFGPLLEWTETHVRVDTHDAPEESLATPEAFGG